jgi:VWFA-related protein
MAGSRSACLALLLILAGKPCALAQTEAPYTFRARSELVQISVVVRDGKGHFVRGLGKDDFELFENGQRQSLAAVDWEAADGETVVGSGQPPRQSVSLPLLTASSPVSAAGVRGLRLVVLYFDLTSLELDDVARSLKAATLYADGMGTADRAAVVALDTRLRVEQDFTADAGALHRALDRVRVAAQAGSQFTDEGEPESANEWFQEDHRLRSLRRISQLLDQLPLKKSVVLFTRPGGDAQGNLASLSATVNAAVRAGVSIYAVDSSGLRARPPLGDATLGSSAGIGVLSGQAVLAQSLQAGRSQDTLFALARDTGGRAFFDTNDLYQAFQAVVEDTREYYLVSYRSPQLHDGRFHRVRVEVRRPGLQVSHQKGFYASHDADALRREDKGRAFEGELFAELPVQDLPMAAALSHARMQGDRYYVPVTVLFPAASLSEQTRAGGELEVGLIFRSQGKTVQRLRETIRPGKNNALRAPGTIVQYNAAAIVPAGDYSARVLILETATGRMGAFDLALALPGTPPKGITVDAMMVGWKKPAGDSPESPLNHAGFVLVPNPLAKFTTADTIGFRYEITNLRPITNDGSVTSELQCSNSPQPIFRAQVKLVPVPSDTAAAQVDIPAGALAPGTYACQATVTDHATGQSAFARKDIHVTAK